MSVYRNKESNYHCCRGKTISIIYSECVSVALFILHSKLMPNIILSSVDCPAVPYFSTLSQERHDFRRKVSDYKICVLVFSTRLI